jgi:hypothetical protein
MKVNFWKIRVAGCASLMLFALSLVGCLSIPVTNDSDFMVEVLPPSQPGDVDRAKDIVDSFSRKYGYRPISGLTTDGTADDSLYKGFGYTGSLHGLRENKLDRDLRLNGKRLPYLVDLASGKNGELFFSLSLRNREAGKDPVAVEFVQKIQSQFGKPRVRVAMPVTVSQLSIGD